MLDLGTPILVIRTRRSFLRLTLCVLFSKAVSPSPGLDSLDVVCE